MLDHNIRGNVRSKWRAKVLKAAHRARTSNQKLHGPVSAQDELKLGFVTPEGG